MHYRETRLTFFKHLSENARPPENLWERFNKLQLSRIPLCPLDAALMVMLRVRERWYFPDELAKAKIGYRSCVASTLAYSVHWYLCEISLYYLSSVGWRYRTNISKATILCYESAGRRLGVGLETRKHVPQNKNWTKIMIFPKKALRTIVRNNSAYVVFFCFGREMEGKKLTAYPGLLRWLRLQQALLLSRAASRGLVLIRFGQY